jgi:hypothetical protein
MRNHIFLLLGIFHLTHSFTTWTGSKYSSGLFSSNDENLEVIQMLGSMTEYFSSMIDTSTYRFYSLSRPQSEEFVHLHCPIRDMGVTWDAQTITLFWDACRQYEIPLTSIYHDIPHAEMSHHCIHISKAIQSTIHLYMAHLVKDENGLILDSKFLKEASSIAHSGFLILLMSSCMLEERKKKIVVEDLISSILSMQRSDGAFCVYFGEDNVIQMIEFYPGEAMVGLMEAYSSDIISSSTKQKLMSSMKKAFEFYSSYYDQGTEVNYNIWQVQAFARFFHVLDENHDNLSNLVANYVLLMCQDIIESPAWKMMARGSSFYPNLQTIEIVCGLDAIMEGIVIAQKISIDTAVIASLDRNAKNAVSFIKTIQNQVPETAIVGKGGLGYGGIRVLEQRLDVTGHAFHALTKVVRWNTSRKMA